MSLIQQLRAERRERTRATNEALRREVDPNRYRTDADRTRLAAGDAARIAAERELNAALLAQQAAMRAADRLAGDDWSSLFWLNIQSGKMTGPAAEAVNRAREAKVAADAARERLQDATRAHQVAVRAIDAAAAAKRRAAKVEAGQLG